MLGGLERGYQDPHSGSGNHEGDNELSVYGEMIASGQCRDERCKGLNIETYSRKELRIPSRTHSDLLWLDPLLNKPQTEVSVVIDHTISTSTLAVDEAGRPLCSVHDCEQSCL